MSSSLIGLNPTQIALATQVPGFKLGTIGAYDDPVNGYREFVYGTTAAATPISITSTVVEGFLDQYSPITTANTAAATLGGHGSRVAVCMTAMAAGDFGWFQIWGKAAAFMAAASILGSRINTTAVPGVPDDDATAGARVLNGFALKTTQTGGAIADVRLTYPSVGATI